MTARSCSPKTQDVGTTPRRASEGMTQRSTARTAAAQLSCGLRMPTACSSGSGVHASSLATGPPRRRSNASISATHPAHSARRSASDQLLVSQRPVSIPNAPCRASSRRSSVRAQRTSGCRQSRRAAAKQPADIDSPTPKPATSARAVRRSNRQIVADAAAPFFGGHLGHLGAETLEHGRAHTDVSNLVFDHTRGRRKDRGRGAEPGEITRDQRRRDDGIALVLTERSPAGDQPRDDLGRQRETIEVGRGSARRRWR